MAEQGPGTRVGRYQLVAAIGSGGMGKVWVALDTAAPTRRLVALKTTLDGTDSGSNPEFWRTLADEASVASRINHPNVCVTHELGYEGNVHFLVMEWSDGASLRDVLAGLPTHRLKPELAAHIVANVAAGLHAAHELCDEAGQSLGVVHRDVSPQNILISVRGHVRLADFGVAKSRGQLHRPTETGEVKGKLSYMAPEQVTSKNIDRRADVFALGCVLYEAVLGVRPFHGPDALATMYKILEEELPRPSKIDPEVPARLEQVLCKALEKDPNARYQTAEEFRDDLLDFIATSGRFVADKHVAEAVAAALGPELTARNQAIISAAEQLRRGETDPRKLQTPTASSPTQTLTPEGGVERSVTVQQRATGVATSPLAYAVTAAVVVFGAVGAWLALTRPTPTVSPALAVSERVAASIPPEPPPPVALATALALNTAPSPVVSAHAPATAAAPTTRSPVTVKPSSRGAARPVEQPTPLSTTKDGETSPGPKPGGKKPRPIDRENPFGAPSE